MAHYTITHTCGHTSVVELFGPWKGRDERIAYLSTKKCQHCLVREAAEITSELGYPPLKGSDRQVGWANRIRISTIERLRMYIEDKKRMASKKGLDVTTVTDDYNEKITHLIQTYVLASWWIDHRYSSLDFFI